MTILVIIEHDNENILPATFNAITAALKLEKPIEHWSLEKMYNKFLKQLQK